MPTERRPTLNQLKRAAIDPKLPPEIRAMARKAADLTEKKALLARALEIKLGKMIVPPVESSRLIEPEPGSSPPSPGEEA